MESYSHKEFNNRKEQFINKIESTEGEFVNEFADMLRSNVYSEGIYEDVKVIHKYLKEGDLVGDVGTGSGFLPFFLKNEAVRIKAIEIRRSDFDKDKFFSGVIGENDEHEYNLRRDAFIETVWKKAGNEGVEYSFYDGSRLPFEDNSLDMIIFHAVWEHIPEELHDSVAAEVKRVLKNNGYFFITRLPRKLSYQEFLSRKLNMGGHTWLVSDKQAKKYFVDKGFEIVKTAKIDMFFAFPHKLWNPVSWLINPLDKLLIKTPLNIFAHGIKMMMRKIV